MRALVLAEFGRMEVRRIPDPVPADGEVLIKVEAVGICGTDVHGFTGDNGRRQPGQVMGHEAAGTILAAPGSDEFREGTLVTFDPLIACGACPACRSGEQQLCAERRVIGVDPTIQAALAEQIVVPTANVVPLPAGLSAEHGALIEPLAVAFHAVRRSGAGDHDHVLVVGGGPIGQSLVLALRAAGVERIILSEPNPGRRKICAELGADVIDGMTGTPHDQLRQVGGHQLDLAIDAVGVGATLAGAMAVTKAGGSITLVGMGAPRVELGSYDISTAERTLIGSFCYADDDFRAAVAWAGEHTAQLDSLISDAVPMDAAQQAFTDLAGDHPAAGKVLVRPNL